MSYVASGILAICAVYAVYHTFSRFSKLNLQLNDLNKENIELKQQVTQCRGELEKAQAKLHESNNPTYHYAHSVSCLPCKYAKYVVILNDETLHELFSDALKQMNIEIHQADREITLFVSQRKPLLMYIYSCDLDSLEVEKCDSVRVFLPIKGSILEALNKRKYHSIQASQVHETLEQLKRELLEASCPGSN
ncbi:MAG: hypothetical protein KBA81_04210 [Rhabdochlamydiaceae bacterium]|nr:hypothetical protein [Rhabdochlamydiaceae bacterium]